MRNARRFFAVCALSALSFAGTRQPPRAGMLVRSSATLPPGTYRLPSSDAAHPAITIRGWNLAVDFTGVTLRGSAESADPDTFAGLAVLVEGGENITIRNLTARGYKIVLLARGTKKLRIVGADVSYGWKARLYSLVEHESLLD